MEDTVKKKISEENQREALRAQRMAARDWSIVLAAAVVFAALLGFIYFAEDTGVSSADIEPAGGSVLSYDTDDVPPPATTPDQNTPSQP